MTDKYTLEEIEFAFNDGPTDTTCFRKLKERLTRPKHNFAEGQVAFCRYLEDDQPTGSYAVVEKEDLQKALSTCRPLTLTEAGPPYQKLVDALHHLQKTHTTDGSWGYIKKALDQFYRETNSGS